MSIKNLIVALIGIFTAIVLVYFLWQTPPLLILCLIMLTAIKRRLAPVPRELTMFIITSLLGPLAESLIMQSGAWSYSSPDIFNFPIWLPFLWGFAGVLFVTIYDALPRKSLLQ